MATVKRCARRKQKLNIIGGMAVVEDENGGLHRGKTVEEALRKAANTNQSR